MPKKIVSPALVALMLLAVTANANAMGGGGSPGGFFGASQSPSVPPPSVEYAPPSALRSFNAYGAVRHHHYHHR